MVATFRRFMGRTKPVFDQCLRSDIEKWRKGSFLHPCCHLVIKAIRYDPPPPQIGDTSLSKALLQKRLSARLTQQALAAMLNISVRTLKNWERGRCHPNRKAWPANRTLFGT
jgi:Helix-turn-helix